MSMLPGYHDISCLSMFIPLFGSMDIIDIIVESVISPSIPSQDFASMIHNLEQFDRAAD